MILPHDHKKTPFPIYKRRGSGVYWKENEFQSLVSIGGLLAPTSLSGAPLQCQPGAYERCVSLPFWGRMQGGLKDH